MAKHLSAFNDRMLEHNIFGPETGVLRQNLSVSVVSGLTDLKGNMVRKLVVLFHNGKFQFYLDVYPTRSVVLSHLDQFYTFLFNLTICTSQNGMPD